MTLRRKVNPLDLDDIQGNILRGYGFPAAGYLFVRVDDPAAGRRWLGSLVDPITTAAEWVEGKPEHTLNVAVTAVGLRALGVPDEMMRTFPVAFRAGMRARADVLGDVGPSDPSGWDSGLGDGTAHVLVTVDTLQGEALGEHMDDLRRSIEEPGSGLTIVHEQRASIFQGSRDQFGFADGFAQPLIEHAGMPERAGRGTPGRWFGWMPVKPGEFVLGYEDEDLLLPESPAPPLGDNGTFMVYRKLYQDVASFRRFLREQGAGFPGGEEKLAAKIVGRWRDGTPLVLSPDAPDPAISGNLGRIDRFRYRDDLDGFRCPIGAHIRRTNPRDALGWGGMRTKRHRIIRRGMPYGAPLPEGVLEDDGVDRGLVFVCYQASLERQFETIQRIWCNDGNIFGIGADRDFLLGGPEGEGKMTIQGDPPHFIRGILPFVQTRGGEYLFMPGLDALRALAAGFPA
ncbi:MAG: Dyp-type peroxidase [Acidimicrobiales bacterium]